MDSSEGPFRRCCGRFGRCRAEGREAMDVSARLEELPGNSLERLGAHAPHVRRLDRRRDTGGNRGKTSHGLKRGAISPRYRGMFYLEHARILAILLDEFRGEGIVLIDLRKPRALEAMAWLLDGP